MCTVSNNGLAPSTQICVRWWFQILQPSLCLKHNEWQVRFLLLLLFQHMRFHVLGIIVSLLSSLGHNVFKGDKFLKNCVQFVLHIYFIEMKKIGLSCFYTSFSFCGAGVELRCFNKTCSSLFFSPFAIGRVRKILAMFRYCGIYQPKLS